VYEFSHEVQLSVWSNNDADAVNSYI